MPSKSSLRDFVGFMTKGPEQTEEGFRIIAARDDRGDFIQAIADAGLFAVDRCPKPEPGDAPNTIRLPIWPALSYLLACAADSTARSDNAKMERIATLLRGLIQESGDSVGDSPVIYRQLAQIMAALPPYVLAASDLVVVSTWLQSKFGNAEVNAVLDEIIANFLTSTARSDWQKALSVTKQCLALRTRPSQRGPEDPEPEPEMWADPFWLGNIVERHAGPLGEKLCCEAAAVFADAVRKLFGSGHRQRWSWLFRPAVEDHEQNYRWRGSENAVVDGLRDALLGWGRSRQEADGLKSFVLGLIQGDNEMSKRVGIYLLNQRWEQLSDILDQALISGFITHGCVHEAFGLLRDRFGEFAGAQKQATLDALRANPEIGPRLAEALPENAPEVQALRREGSFAESQFGPHPDLNSYIEAANGPGPSAYSAEDLIALALDGELVRQLNAFQPTNHRRDASIDGLCSTLERAVASAPGVFIDRLDVLIPAQCRFQASVVNAVKDLWKGKSEAVQGWDNAWRALIEYFEKVCADLEAHREDEGQQGLIVAVADALQEGTRDDAWACPPGLLLRVQSILQTLVSAANPIQTAPSENVDAMMHAINSPKGRVIEAIFTHALRICRVADKEGSGHEPQWAGLQQSFERELNLCAQGNFEFSTLAGAFLANLDFLSHRWTSANIVRLFPPNRPPNLACALDGLRYAPLTESIWSLLKAGEVFETAMGADLPGRAPRYALTRFLVWAYLNDLEKAGDLIDLLFKPRSAGDLDAAIAILAGLRRECPAKEKCDRIVTFWKKAGAVKPNDPKVFFTSLADLAWALPNATGLHKDLLLQVAPWAGREPAAFRFMEDLLRLSESSPAEVAEVFEKAIKESPSNYDYKDNMKQLIRFLFGAGQRDRALEACAVLRRLPGFTELASELQSA